MSIVKKLGSFVLLFCLFLSADSMAALPNYFVATYDSGGTKISVTPMAQPRYNGTSVVDPLSGTTYSVGERDVSGKDIAFLDVYDDRGRRLWGWELDLSFDNDYTGGRGVAINSAGNVYVCGTVDTNSMGAEAWITKYDSKGNRQWLQQFGDSDYDAAISVAIDGSGNVYVAGYTYGTLGGNSNAARRTSDIFVAKYDSEGRKQWLRQFGSSDHYEEATGLSIDSNGHVNIYGVTRFY